MNQREYFRLPVENVTGQFGLVRVGERSVPLRLIPTEILNISAGGLLLRSELDLPIRQGITIQVQFSLNGQEFRFLADLMRKTDTLTSYEYGGEFIDLTDRTRQSLIEMLNRVQLSRKQADRVR